MLSIIAIVLMTQDAETLRARYFADIPAVSVSIYEIEGRGAAEVRASLDQRRPKRPDGTPAYTITSWKLPTRWTSDLTGQCSPATVRISATFETILPQLSAAAELNAEERAKWTGYIDYLGHLEAERMERVINGARMLERRMRMAPSCDSLNEMLSLGVKSIGDDARSLDIEAADQSGRVKGFP